MASSASLALPESRVARIEIEAADDGRPVVDRVRVQLLAALRAEMVRRTAEHSDERKVFSAAAVSAARNVDTSEDAIDEACELAEVERTIGGGDRWRRHPSLASGAPATSGRTSRSS